jgi:AcrR family transcriptional regulator
MVNKSTDPGQSASRSEERIPKLRRRGRENRRKLLAEAERLLLESDGSPLKFSDVFEAAGVSRGSAYRIYIGVDDLLQDLATEWINNFVSFLKSSAPASHPESWAQLSDFIVRQGAVYWRDTSDTMRVLPRIRSNAPASYSLAVRAMSDCLSDIFNRYFVIPEVPGWLTKLAFFTQICDITFADAVRSEGHISEQRLTEAETLCRTYLAFYLPTGLPARDSVVT